MKIFKIQFLFTDDGALYFDNVNINPYDDVTTEFRAICRWHGVVISPLLSNRLSALLNNSLLLMPNLIPSDKKRKNSTKTEEFEYVQTKNYF